MRTEKGRENEDGKGGRKGVGKRGRGKRGRGKRGGKKEEGKRRQWGGGDKR